MTSYPGQPAAPSRTLTKVAVGCFVVGLLLSGFFIWRLVQSIPSAPVPVDRGAVTLEKEGLTVFASVPAPMPTCEAKDANGTDIALERPQASEQFAINGETYYVVAHSVEPIPPQTVAVDCVDDESGATYYVGARHTFGTFFGSVFGAIGSFGLFFVIGLVLIIVDSVRRRRANPTGGFRYPGQFPTPGYPGTMPPPTQAQPFPGYANPPSNQPYPPGRPSPTTGEGTAYPQGGYPGEPGPGSATRPPGEGSAYPQGGYPGAPGPGGSTYPPTGPRTNAPGQPTEGGGSEHPRGPQYPQDPDDPPRDR